MLSLKKSVELNTDQKHTDSVSLIKIDCLLVSVVYIWFEELMGPRTPLLQYY